MDRSAAGVVCLVLCVCAAVLGVGISVAVIAQQDPNLISADNVCPSVPANITSFKLEKNFLNQWHWSYSVSNAPSLSGAYARQKCVSLNYDSMFFLGSALSAYLDGKIASIRSTTYIRDCTGAILYTIDSGSAFQTLINSNNILVSFILYDADRRNVLAYSDGTHFLSDDIVIRDVYGNVVAEMTRSIVSFTWSVTVHNTSHPAGDVRVLSLLAAKRSFSQDASSTDICNAFIVDATIASAVIGACLGCLLCLGMGSLIYAWYIRMTRNVHYNRGRNVSISHHIQDDSL